MSRVLTLLAAAVLLLFAGMWVWIAIKLLGFHPTTAHPKLAFTSAQVTVAGFLASAVGAGTASVLGIEIQKVQAAAGQTVAFQVGQAAKSSFLLFVGIAAYALVGIVVLLAWLAKSNDSPDMIGAFALGVLGWLAGAFAAVFRKSP
jgi:hypothetical protein